MNILLKMEMNGSNPWSVEDVSAFLRYCCPECEYKNQNLQNFSNHALENHANSVVFFTPEEILKIKSENCDTELEYFSKSAKNSNSLEEQGYFDSGQIKIEENADLIRENQICNTETIHQYQDALSLEFKFVRQIAGFKLVEITKNPLNT